MKRQLLTALGVFLSIGLAGLGCVTTVPSTQSASKFVREGSDSDSANKLSAMGAVQGVSSKSDDGETRLGQLLGFNVEGAYSAQLANRYDLVVSGGNYLANVDGNYALWLEGMRLGLLHGVGLGYYANENTNVRGDKVGWSHNFKFNGSSGVFFQLSEASDGTFFSAARYTFSAVQSVYPEEAVPDDEETSELAKAHYGTLNLGYLVPLKEISLSPEVALNYGRLVDDQSSVFIVTVGATVAK